MDDDYKSVIPRGVLVKGRITIYADTPSETRLAVEAYNRRVNDCKVALQQVAVYKNVIQTITPMVSIAFMLLGLMHTILYPIFRGTIIDVISEPVGFWNAPVCMAALIALLAVCVHFGIMKNNLRMVTLASAALIIVHWYSVAIVALNFLCYHLYNRVDAPLQKEEGYPAFIPIRIHYESCKEPHCGEMTNFE